MKKLGLLVSLGILFCLMSSNQVLLSADHVEQQINLAKILISDDAYLAILQFYQYDKGIPLDPIVIRKSETEAHTLEKIAFKGAGEFLVPVYFAVPKKGKPPYPCILLLHGMTLSKEQWWEADSWHKGPALAPKLLANGFAVLGIDYPLHGERSILNAYDNTAQMLFRKRLIYKFRDMVIDGVIDCRRALDYLECREEIDSTRIGVIGSSLGGTISLLLTGIDSRVKVTTALVAPTLIRPIYEGQPDISSIAPYNFVRAFDRRPILMLMGKNDDFNYTVAGAKALYDLIRGDSKEIHFYDCGHRLPEEYSSRAVEWFNKYLK
jgi:dienelactone hydrolase